MGLLATSVVLGIFILIVSIILLALRYIRLGVIGLAVAFIWLFGLAYINALWDMGLSGQIILAVIFVVALYLIFGKKKGRK